MTDGNSEMKPREWWIKQGSYSGDGWGEPKDAFYSCVWNEAPESEEFEQGFIHVIEYSAFEAQNEMIEMLREALDDIAKTLITGEWGDVDEIIYDTTIAALAKLKEMKGEG